MTTDEPGPRSQRTVAELLAQYGEGPATGRRRARRQAADPDGQEPAAPGNPYAGPAPNGAANGSEYVPPQAGPSGGSPVAQQFGAPQYGSTDRSHYGQAPPPQFGRQGLPQVGQRPPPEFGRQPAEFGQPPAEYGRQPAEFGQPPAEYGRQPAPLFGPPQGTPGGPPGGLPGAPDEDSTNSRWPHQSRRQAREARDERSPLQPEASWAPAAPTQERPTEQLPRYPNLPRQGRGPEHVNGGPATVQGRPGAFPVADQYGPATGAMSPEELLEETTAGSARIDGPVDFSDQGRPSNGVASAATELVDPELVDPELADAELIDDPELDEPIDSASRAHRKADSSPTTAWLAMVAQWIGGAVGGAALWVAFRYLWSTVEIAALVAAVLVIAGLVLLVRAIRRSDDLRTTVFAVLVGLVVTVSPAVLVLVTTR